MYVSPAVRSIREHPIEGESTTLLVSVADGAAVDDVRDAIAGAGGRIERTLEFETLAVSVPQTDVGEICALDGIESIETDQTLAIDADGAGEDVSTPGE
ncbi:hypothetical protein [Halorhabdus rudnickae]|uniref:hypothetical protein n=1 Tax=Halorhabdus rudnickae TaxID=1775544 RepID=UPI0010823949|nr:hypothetical protein [Halorhabdus rudnickae]